MLSHVFRVIIELLLIYAAASWVFTFAFTILHPTLRGTQSLRQIAVFSAKQVVTHPFDLAKVIYSVALRVVASIRQR